MYWCTSLVHHALSTLGREALNLLYQDAMICVRGCYAGGLLGVVCGLDTGRRDRSNSTERNTLLDSKTCPHIAVLGNELTSVSLIASV